MMQLTGGVIMYSRIYVEQNTVLHSCLHSILTATFVVIFAYTDAIFFTLSLMYFVNPEKAQIRIV